MIEFQGRSYYHDKASGYYKTLMREGDREYLHRAIYRGTYGNIPHGWQVHHKNEDKDDNSIENLECMPLREHNRKHREQARASGHLTIHLTRIKKPFVCAGCGATYMGKDNGRNSWCSRKCSNAYHNARHL